ncbi:M23 family metallopeptidase [Mycolicibacterium litorale]|uniref:Membrane protein n=1 Tax=Mycolicibacterium litorale TaxID=758802 RepID=A0AAD1IRF3_9MYCO|nr:M23 family metallopeptidase [Mycolicibacterium litorale]MCV7418462.1 M23 family metallopeptidase [Mycolicibacterium litorale]TDY06141.1 peptidase M23-like protein [Mycolicibacterium litorale]BBY19716.1 membrane protein [Mycolicibacterium litorale]
MAAHRSSRSREGVSTNARPLQAISIPAERAAEVTDIIPFNEFGDLDDLDFRDSTAFDREAQVIGAPELDDLHDTDDLIPLRLAIPAQFRAGGDAADAPRRSRAYRDSHTDVSDGTAATDIIDLRARRGAHRKDVEGPIKSRLVIAAMAAGATAAGAYSMTQNSAPATTDTVLAAGSTTVEGASITGSVDGMQIVSVASTANASVHTEEIQKAAAFAQERAEREARQLRPLYVMPTKGVWTSGFGYRWGVLHGGIDIAGPIGTPILAAADGVVIDVGPTAGYGAWVKLRHADGTVTLYGHLNTWSVSIGEQVMAGDQIATMGNRGNSTGPHLHFEVLLGGSNRIDPVGWLSKRGITTGSYVG